MVSILDLQDRQEVPAAPPPPPEALEGAALEPEAPAEFEFVLGRRQVASLLFVSTIVLVVFVAVAYLAGKSTVAKPAPAPVVAELPVTPPAPIVVKQEAPPAVEITGPEPPIFADPKVGAVYIQMGVVERGIAEIFAEGLRRKGLPGFVGPGPTPKEFRVLIGPLPDPASFVKAKEAVDRIGLTTFARRYPD
jgi:hypothetical protein